MLGQFQWYIDPSIAGVQPDTKSPGTTEEKLAAANLKGDSARSSALAVVSIA